MPTPLDITIVEDHIDLRDLFADFLRGEGHQVVAFGYGDELDEYLIEGACDLLLLDLNLPGEDGLSIAARLRATYPDLHILMLTARTAVEDRIRGYASGADLYLGKPVSPAELGAAVGSIARRVAHAREQVPHLGLDPDRLVLTSGDVEVALSRPELLLLKAMAVAPGATLDYWRCLELLELPIDDRGKGSLEVRISRLKKKLRDAGIATPVIKALWKEGYRLCLPVRVVR